MLENFNLEQVDVNKWVDLALLYGVKVISALLILIIGWIVAKLVRGVVRKAMARARMDSTLCSFLSNIVYALVVAFVLIASLNQLGVQTASLVAVIGAAGLAVGLALQGSLSNFAAGIMIILFKHFKVGDAIETNDVSGTVSALDIFNTTVTTFNNQKVIVPNSVLINGALTNYTDMPTRRIDTVVGIGYSDDIALAKKTIMDVIVADNRVLHDPAPLVAVKELGDSSVNLVVRAWTKTDEFWDVQFALIENIKLALDKAGISIPFPQREMHIIQKTIES